MEENGDIVNVAGEGKEDVKWVKFEERKLVEDKGIQFDIQRSVEKVGENKEKGNNEGDDKGNVEGGNSNNNNEQNEKNDVKDSNVPVVVEENKQQQQQQEVQGNNVNGDNNNNVNSNSNEQQQQQQQQQTTPLSSSEVFNILNEINFEMDTISNNLTTTLNFDPDKSIKNLITQVNSLHPDNTNTIQKTTHHGKHIEDRGTQPSYIMYPSSSQKTLSLTTPHPHHHHKPKKHTHKKTQMTALYQGIDITIPRTKPLHRKPIIYMQSESSSHNPTHTRTLPTHKHSSHPYNENIPTINTAIDILTEHH